jgi:hypothetical protein
MGQGVPEVSEEDWRSWEPEWLTAEESWRGPIEAMCKILRGLEHRAEITFSQRKWRLFVVACLRRVRHVFQDERTRGLVDALGQVAEGLMTYDEFRRLEEQAIDPPNKDTVVDSETCSPEIRAVACAGDALYFASNDPVDFFDAYTGAAWMREALGGDKTEEQVQAVLLRDLFGNPFRPVSLERAWRSPSVLALAKAAYDERITLAGELDPNCLGILSDALEEAGCSNPEILGHLRSPGPHVRGCWAVDLLLAKE